MAQDAILENPLGAFVTVANYTLGVNSNGEVVTPELRIATYRANAAITKGQALMFVSPTSTVPVSVSPQTAASDSLRFAGAAFEDAAAGEAVRVVIEGHCLVNVGAGTAAADSYVLTAETTTGVFDVDAALDAGDTAVGIYWGVKNANNLAFAYINRNGLPPAFVVNT